VASHNVSGVVELCVFKIKKHEAQEKCKGHRA
jgi:hypothetical protein